MPVPCYPAVPWNNQIMVMDPYPDMNVSEPTHGLSDDAHGIIGVMEVYLYYHRIPLDRLNYLTGGWGSSH